MTREEYINHYIRVYNNNGVKGSGGGLAYKPSYLKEAGYSDEMTLLDYGCGCGFILDGINPKDYIGVDIVPLAIDIAKEKHPERKFEVLEIGKLKCPPMDFSIAMSVFTHARYEDVDDCLQDIYRATKNGGTALIDILEGDKPETEHIRYWNKAKFENKLKNNGFKIEKIFYKTGINQYTHLYFVLKK